MSAGVDVLQWGRERARAGPWRGDGRVAYLTPTAGPGPGPSSPAANPGPVTPSAEFLHRCLGELAAKGYSWVITAALAPIEQAAFVAVGFEEHERLRLLVHDLCDLPARRHGSAIRWARPADWSAVLAVDSASFPSFWQLDRAGLDEALNATPSSRFRVATGARGVVAGYALSGRSRRDGFLQRLAVDSAYRGQGLGAALVVDGLRWMRRWGVERAVVNTQQGNEAAFSLYRSLGFEEQHWGLSVLRRSLP